MPMGPIPKVSQVASGHNFIGRKKAGILRGSYLEAGERSKFRTSPRESGSTTNSRSMAIRRRRPGTLVFTETHDRITDAIARKRQIKGRSRRQKEALIALAYETLPALHVEAN